MMFAVQFCTLSWRFPCVEPQTALSMAPSRTFTMAHILIARRSNEPPVLSLGSILFRTAHHELIIHALWEARPLTATSGG